MAFTTPKKICFALLLACSTILVAQVKEPCGNGQYFTERYKHDAKYRRAIDEAEKNAQHWLAKHNGHFKDNSSDKIVVPVVFHVVYHKDSAKIQKISRERLLQQIEILNRDFNRENRDKVNTRPIFDTIAGSANIVFTLATTDPEGNPTEGITYTSTNMKGFDMIPFQAGYTALDNIKCTPKGGRSPWPTDKYLNVWVGRLAVLSSEGLYGIATFPQNMPPEELEGQEPVNDSLEGIAIHFPTVGNTFAANGDAVYLGRTLSHEIGHFFGLRHVWGDGFNECATDFVDDTPMSSSNANFECLVNKNTCNEEHPRWGSVNPPDNVENYMDYSGDACQNMFSNGQCSRMMAFAATGRDGLWQNNSSGGKDTEAFKAWGYTSSVSDCPSDCDGSIQIIAQKGTPPYQYTVDGASQAQNEFTAMCEGIHKVQVTDVSGNTVAFDLYVAADRYMKPSFTRTVTNASCFSCPNGKIRLVLKEGRTPVTVTWDVDPPVTGLELNGVPNGWYRYTITDACGETYTDSAKVNSPTSIAELPESAFQIYPNPGTDRTTLSFNNSTNLKRINIYSMAGSLLRSVEIQEAVIAVPLNVADLARGIYCIELVDHDMGRKTIRFIKE